MSLLHVLVLMTADVHLDAQPGRPRLRAGERYNLREDVAAPLVAAGDAEPLEVQEQVTASDPEHPVPTEDRAACMTRMLALVPKQPAPPPAPSTPPAGAPPEPKE